MTMPGKGNGGHRVAAETAVSTPLSPDSTAVSACNHPAGVLAGFPGTDTETMAEFADFPGGWYGLHVWCPVCVDFHEYGDEEDWPLFGSSDFGRTVALALPCTALAVRARRRNVAAVRIVRVPYYRDEDGAPWVAEPLLTPAQRAGLRFSAYVTPEIIAARAIAADFTRKALAR